MTWILWGVYGAASLVLVNAFIRANPWGLSFWLLILFVTPLTAIGTQAGFVKLYQGAPSFFVAWFLGTALSSVAGVCGSLIIFKEVPSLLHILGVCLILGGVCLLTR